MKLSELIEKNQKIFVENSFDYTLSVLSAQQDIEIPKSIEALINHFVAGEQIDGDELNQFREYIEQQNEGAKDSLSLLIFNISKSLLKEYQEEISDAGNQLEKTVLQNNKSQSNQVNEIDSNYYSLLNCYQLSSVCIKHLSTNSKYHIQGNFLTLHSSVMDEIPLAINLFRMTGKLPKNFTYCHMNVDMPLYPINLPSAEHNIAGQGIKKINEYFPYQKVSKQLVGGVKSSTMKATNGSRITFFRGNVADNRKGVLASKLATLISKEHFASEFLLENRYTVSKKHAHYISPLSNHDVFDVVAKRIKEEGHYPGMGTIDAVLGFVGENDENPENFAMSSLNTPDSFLTKIDFDMCQFDSDAQNKLSVFFKNPAIQDNKEYQLEKTKVAIKLSFIPDLLLDALALKSGFKLKEDKKFINLVKDRKNSAGRNMNAGFSFDSDEDLIKQLSTARKEILAYIETHQFGEQYSHDSLCDALDKQILQVIKGNEHKDVLDVFEVAKMVKEEKGNYPDLGTIDAALGFVDAQDRSLSKIHFDKLLGFIKDPAIQKNTDDQIEKAKVTIKMSFLPDLLLNALALKSGFKLEDDKSFIDLIKNKKNNAARTILTAGNAFDLEEDFIKQLGTAKKEILDCIETNQFDEQYSRESLRKALNTQIHFVIQRAFRKDFKEILDEIDKYCSADQQSEIGFKK